MSLISWLTVLRSNGWEALIQTRSVIHKMLWFMPKLSSAYIDLDENPIEM
jgi:hypothetical protein